MSHRGTFSLENYSLKPLLSAFNALGWKIVEKASARGVYGTFPYVAKNPDGSWDIGIQVDANGKVDLVYDSDIRCAETSIGKGFEFLKQQYQEETTKNIVRQHGGRVRSRKVVAHKAVALEIEINI